jgi:hypothetical protein
LLDDYAFLGNAFHFSARDYLPNAGDTFYRPISRGAYFALLWAVGDLGPLLGHGINALALALIACLVGGAGARLGGHRSGILSGILFAGLACAPTLVAWVSCSQDLLAMLCAMLALHSRLSGRKYLAVGFIALGALCKETAFAVVPALLLVDLVRGLQNPGWKREVSTYAILAGAWLVIHPAARLAGDFTSGKAGYVGVPRLHEALMHAGSYALEVCNLRLGRTLLTWSPWEVVLLAISVLVGIAWIWFALARTDRLGDSLRHPVMVGALMAVGPFLLTSATLLKWSPYYAAFPALGTSIAVGAWLRGRSRLKSTAMIAVFLALGLVSRTSESKTAILTENDIRISSDAHQLFNANLRKVLPIVPHGAQLLFSIQAKGRARIYHSIHDYKMPQLLYRDRTLTVRKPEEREAMDGPEFLLAVYKDLDIISVDPISFAVASASGETPSYHTVEHALRTYAVGLANTGRIDDGASLLVRMPDADLGYETLHHRMAAMVLLAAGRETDARRLATGVPQPSRRWVMETIPAILAQQPPEGPFDASGLRAFGIDSTDVDAIRELARVYLTQRLADPAGRFGRRLLILAPGDSVGLAAVAVSDSAQASRTPGRQ